MIKFLSFGLAALLGVSACTSLVSGRTSRAFVHFDHTYNTVHDFNFKEQLSLAGFTLDSKTTEHPGSLLCHFVRIGQAELADHPPYLEFCYIQDKNAYLEEQKTDPDFDSKNPAPRFQIKGLSFGYSGDFRRYIEILKQSYPQITAEHTHKNYDWKTNSKDRLPGWNFVEFSKMPLPGDFYVWFTSNDPRPNQDQNNRPKEFRHKNGAARIVGSVIDLRAPEAAHFVQAITFKRFVDDQLILDDGFRIINFANLNANDQKLFEKSKATYKAVIVEADANTLDALGLPYEAIEYRGTKVKRVRFADFNWDIFLTRGPLAK